MDKKFIPVNEPVIGEREIKNVMDCLKTGWISSAGEYIPLFEDKWAQYCERKFGVAVSNGSVALEAAFACLGLEEGDEVIMPTFTIISCASAIVRSGAVPVLVDSDPDTWCMDVSQVTDKLTDKTKAILAVHIYGHPVDMDPIIKIAKENDLFLIEDAAEAHGAEYLTDRGELKESWRKCGSFGDLSIFSFYANKIITTGEGGMILVDDPKYAEKLKSFRNLCFLPEQRFLHKELGNNFRLTNMQAAIGVAQVEQIDKYLEKKRWIGNYYTQGLKHLDMLQLPIEKSWAKNVYWMFGIVLDEKSGFSGQKFADQLLAKGIQTRPFFWGMHEQPVFHGQGLFLNESYPIAEKIARQGIYLPTGLALRQDQMDYVIDGVCSLFD